MSTDLTHEVIRPFVGQGLVRSQTRGSLTIYSYTQSCMFERAWNPVTVACRGLILDHDNTVIARPWNKFFNYREPGCGEIPVGHTWNVFEKIDGSLIIAYWYEGRWNVATRGSFDNPYVDYAKTFLSTFGNLPTDLTYMFEVVLPPGTDPMPRAVKHDPGLYYLGARETHSGKDMGQFRSEYWPTFTARSYGEIDINQLAKWAETEEGQEGWVVRWSNGFRLKVKTAWYLKLFRAISQISEKHFRELYAEDCSSLVEGYTRILAEIPEELRAESEQILTKIQVETLRRLSKIDDSYQEVLNLFPFDRKQLANHIKTHPDKAYIFQKLDGKDIVRDLILKG